MRLRVGRGMTAEAIIRHVQQCLRLGCECEWVEIKENNADPEMIGQRLAGLANSAALAGQSHGFWVWGIEDGSLPVIGTRLGLDDKQYPTASRNIKDTLDQTWIRPQDQMSTSHKDAKYVPYWA